MTGVLSLGQDQGTPALPAGSPGQGTQTWWGKPRLSESLLIWLRVVRSSSRRLMAFWMFSRLVAWVAPGGTEKATVRSGDRQGQAGKAPRPSPHGLKLGAGSGPTSSKPHVPRSTASGQFAEKPQAGGGGRGLRVTQHRVRGPESPWESTRKEQTALQMARPRADKRACAAVQPPTEPDVLTTRLSLTKGGNERTPRLPLGLSCPSPRPRRRPGGQLSTPAPRRLAGVH